MMYKHKNLKQLLCCVLLLCLFYGSSLGFFSVKADTTVGDNSFLAHYQQTYSDYNLQMQTRVNTSKWNLVATDVDVEYLYNFTQAKINSFAYTATHSQTTGAENGVGKTFTYNGNGTLSGTGAIRSQYYIYQRQIVVYVMFKSNNGNDLRLGNGNMQVTLSGVADSFSGITVADQQWIHFAYLYDYVDDFNNQLYFRLDDTFCAPNGYFYIPAGAAGFCSLTIDQYLYTTEPLADDHTHAPTSVQITGFGGVTEDNSQAQNLVSRDARVTNSTITSEGDQTQSAITSQTQQDKEQYDAYSAHTDSSDSNNINSAITGGTDAVKEKMGLFSFFDGIVTDLSDTLTKDHERHLVLPALDVPLPEETVHIWDRKEFDFDELENNFGAILTVVRFATVAICYVTMINGAYHLFHKFIGVKDSDA